MLYAYIKRLNIHRDCLTRLFQFICIFIYFIPVWYSTVLLGYQTEYAAVIMYL